MKSQHSLRATILLVFLLVSLIPGANAGALAPAALSLPPAGMFQLPWDQGLSWVAIDGLDNGTDRPLNSSHYYLSGGAIDFAPHNDMQVGEDTSNDWVTADAAGTISELGTCYLKIDHGNGWISEYQFIGNMRVKLGDVVYRNQRLAIIADGIRIRFCAPDIEPGVPHLHFMLRPSIRNATFSGWVINYNSQVNLTTFVKGSQALGLFKPLLNTPGLQIVLRDPLTWDKASSGSVDAYLYERWPISLSGPTNFTLTATPVTSGLTPLLILLDANGNELARSTATLTTTQPAGSYFVQIQPQTGNGFYQLLAHNNGAPLPSGPSVSTVVNPASINVGGKPATATVNLNNLPAGGYTSAEFTCTYDASLVTTDTILATNLFGTDPVVAISGPLNGSFIVAIAGSNGQLATTGGAAFTFAITGLQPGQTPVNCTARVSTGSNVLTSIASVPASLTILAAIPTPTLPPASTSTATLLPTFTPMVTATFTPFPTGTMTRTVTSTSIPATASTSTGLPTFTPLATFTPTSTVTRTSTTPPTFTPLPSFTPLPTFTSTATPLVSPSPTITATPLPAGTVTGQVLAGKPVHVTLYAGKAVIASVAAGADGSFSLTAPAGSYTLAASASGFLGAQGPLTITAGGTTGMPKVSLLAGDIDGNNIIDQFDALTIGMNYNLAVPTAADLNGDGLINVLDLELLAHNYRKTGPLAWQ